MTVRSLITVTCTAVLVGCPLGEIHLRDDDTTAGDDDTTTDGDDTFDDDDGPSDCLYWGDADGDGYGNPDDEILESCDGPPGGHVDNPDDCDDADPEIHPDAQESCDGFDNDCDGITDANDPDYAGDSCDDGTVCSSLGGTDQGIVPSWTGHCDVDAGYAAHDGHCYYPAASAVNWPDARATCAAAGGYLATISDEAEHQFIDDLHARPHLGGCDGDVEGTFRWITGEPWVFELWATDEPNDMGTGEDCLEIGLQGDWNDIWCDDNPYTEGFVCEFG
jgi:hypothetical protein